MTLPGRVLDLAEHAVVCSVQDALTHRGSMPTRAPRPCATPGCPELTRSGPRCEQHTKAREAQRRTQRGPRPYDLAAWKRLRFKKLGVDRQCERQTHCQGARATEVHHKDGDKWNWAWGNLESTCKPCHSAHTAKEQGFAKGERAPTPATARPAPQPWGFA